MEWPRRRKAAYEALHPETVNGSNQHTRVRQVGEGSEAPRFTADTAAKTGQSERAVQRDAERGEKVCDEALRLRYPLDFAMIVRGFGLIILMFSRALPEIVSRSGVDEKSPGVGQNPGLLDDKAR